jgi:hypothetical protein
MLVMIGCKSLLPEKAAYSRSPWESFEQARDSFSKIKLGVTTLDDLREVGIDIDKLPNVKHLTYLDVANKFGMISLKPDSRIKVPRGVLMLVKAGDRGRAYEIDAEAIKHTRQGNFLADWLGFRKNTHETGWKFKILMIVIDDKVEYVLHSGTPQINNMKKEKNPLGPLQNLSGGDAISAGVKLAD